MLEQSKKMHNQSGLTMIESLVSLLVISIGLLGIAALQISSLQQTASAQWHSQAVWYSYEMIDRINANRDSFNDYIGVDTNAENDQNCRAEACTPAQLVTADAREWGEMMQSLPGGRGQITDAGNNSLLVTVMWNDNSAESNCINPVEDMTCYEVTIQ